MLAPAPQPSDDSRYRTLLGARDWARLPPPVRRRFARRLGPGDSVVYRGVLTEARRSLAGRLLAQALRVSGAPLPLSASVGRPSIVSVTEDGAGGGQVWSRVHCTPRGFPQTIHSAKRFSGPTGLEEFVAPWLSIALRPAAEAEALVLVSDHVALHLAGRRLRLPAALAPGLTVRHEELGRGRFRFAMTLAHPVLGTLLHQAGIYREARP